jgi:hypothetical protein
MRSVGPLRHRHDSKLGLSLLIQRTYHPTATRAKALPRRPNHPAFSSIGTTGGKIGRARRAPNPPLHILSLKHGACWK